MLLNQVIRHALSVPLCSQQLACVLTVENMKEQIEQSILGATNSQITF